MTDTTKVAVRELVNQYTQGVVDTEFAKEISVPEMGITYTHGTLTNLRAMTQRADLRRMRLVTLYGHTERARQFARAIIEAEGFKVIETTEQPGVCWVGY